MVGSDEFGAGVPQSYEKAIDYISLYIVGRKARTCYLQCTIPVQFGPPIKVTIHCTAVYMYPVECMYV